MIRVMAPDGTIGEIPVESLDGATQEGYRVMTDVDMATLFNRQEFERRLFEKDWKKKHGSLRLPRGKGKW